MSEDPRPLADLSDSDEDRPSITEVNGTVAKFTMAYSPDAGPRRSFGPPTITMLPSLIYLAFALGVVGMVMLAHGASSNSSLYVWVVEGDKGRPFGSGPLSGFIALSAVATVVRARLRGAVVGPDGVETRTLLAMGIPRIRKLAWPQIDRVVIDDENESVVLELWNGAYERLPDVRDRKGLADMIEGYASSRRKQITHLARKGP